MAISYLDNLNIKKKAPNVERDLFATVADMVAWSENYLPAIFSCFVEETGKRYRYNVANTVDATLGKWREDEGGSSDLTDYYKKTETDDLLDDKVDKEENKGLSTNDYSDTEKQKLSDLSDFVDSATAMTTTATTVTGAIKELVDKDAELKDLIDDNAEEIEKLKKTPAIAVDEKPTYSGGTITYVKDGETKTTEDADLWFYYSVGTALYQTIFIGGVEKTIESGGVDFDEFVKKDNIIDTLDSVATDKPLSANMGKKLNDDMATELAKKLDIAQGEDNAGKALIVDDDGNIALADADTLGNKAENISYEHATHTEWTNVKKALDGIIAKVEYVKPEITSFTVTPSDTVYETGSTIASLAFAWAYNKDVTSQTLTDVTLTDETDRTATFENLSASKTFELSCSDGENTAKKSISIAFRNKVYWGSASIPADYDSAFILGLSKSQFATAKKGTYSMTVGNGEYGYIAYPASFGSMSSWYVGGFDTTVESCGDIAFTNASGATVTYSVYRTGRSGLGSITAEIK